MKTKLNFIKDETSALENRISYLFYPKMAARMMVMKLDNNDGK